MGKYDVAVIGGGSAGLTIASGAAALGARVALIEKDKMGGDCLNYGCVPTKALIRSASVAHIARQAGKFGVNTGEIKVDMQSVMSRMRGVVRGLAEHDSRDRFRRLGVDVFFGDAEFRNSNEIGIGDARIFSKKIVIATGSRPAIPVIEGLSETGFITNVEALELQSFPKSLVILGGGPIGLEFAQVFARLGVTVTVVEAQSQILPKEDHEAAEIVRNSMEQEGIRFLVGSKVVRASKHANAKIVTIEKNDSLSEISSEEIFVAIGRRPNTEVSGLKELVEMNSAGIVTDLHLRTAVPHIFAAGDVIGGLQFTHVAGYEGKVVVQNTLFPLQQRVNYRVVPWVIFTDPEIAHVGLTESEARERYGRVEIYKMPLLQVDRAVIDGELEGMVKVISNKGGQILGAHVVGPHAGEIVQELVLAMHRKIPLSRISEVIHAYPTRVESLRKTADLFWRQRFFQGHAGVLLKILSRITR